MAPKENTRTRLLGIAVLLSTTVMTSTAVWGQTPPEQFLGFKPGADFHLATYEQAMEYFDLLAGQTGRLKMLDMGPTSEGRRMRYAAISSEENLAQLDRYKEVSRRLSLARGVSTEEAERLADEGRAIVWIDGGLHATEVAPAQHHLQLAYDLITGNDRRTRLIRDQVILLLVFANPDGMTLVANWYMGNVGTEFETSPLPELYHKYAGHDNNRDSMLSNLIETRNMNRATSHEWFPEILYNQHQSAPFPSRIFIPPEAESTNPNVHPLILRWKNLIGTAMGKSFEEANQPGAISRIGYDNWWPGYVTQIVESHNIPAILTETALYRYATPRYYTIDDFPESHRDLVMGTFYPSPWPGGWWRLGDAVAYNLTASKSVLEVAAKFRHELLFNKWKMATDVMHRFKQEPPYGWVISADQRDRSTTMLLIERLMDLGVEVSTADEVFSHAGVQFPAGSFVLSTEQPFGLFVKNVLEIQNFPDLREHPHLWQGLVGTFTMRDQPPLRPYDGVGWTLPLQMGVRSLELVRPVSPEVKLTQVTSLEPLAGEVRGDGPRYVFARSDNRSFTAVNRLLASGASVGSAVEAIEAEGIPFPRGSFVVEATGIGKSELSRIAAETGIIMHAVRSGVQTKSIKAPRIAVYKSWVANMDAGWMRWIFENYGFPYHSLTDAEVRAGSLMERFDVIILPDQRSSSIVNGHRKGTIHPNYVGGMTSQGVEHLKTFVHAGGVLISNASSNDLPIASFGIPVKNVLDDVGRNDFNIPGSLLKMGYDLDHAVAFGMEERGIAYFSGDARAYEPLSDKADDEPPSRSGTSDEDRPRAGRGGTTETPKVQYNRELKPVTVARYPHQPLLVSGWQVGEEMLQGKSAILSIQVGKGSVILFGFNVINRAQAYGTFKLLFNAILEGAVATPLGIAERGAAEGQ